MVNNNNNEAPRTVQRLLDGEVKYMRRPLHLYVLTVQRPLDGERKSKKQNTSITMAIHIDWQVLPAPKRKKGEQPQLYPRLIDNEVVDFRKLCEKVSNHSSQSIGTVISVVIDTIDVMKMLLHEGKTIDLEDLGVFKLAICTDSYVTPTTPNSKRKVVVRGVNFQPNKMLMDAIDTPKFRTVSLNASPMVLSIEQLQRTLTKYFKTHDSITRSQVETLCKMKRTTACARLSDLVKSGFFRKIGYNKETKDEIVKHDEL